MHEQISGYQHQGISVKTLPDEDYPELLRNIYNPPFILYYKGDFSLTQQFDIAIMGSRAATVCCNYQLLQPVSVAIQRLSTIIKLAFLSP